MLSLRFTCAVECTEDVRLLKYFWTATIIIINKWFVYYRLYIIIVIIQLDCFSHINITQHSNHSGLMALRFHLQKIKLTYKYTLCLIVRVTKYLCKKKVYVHERKKYQTPIELSAMVNKWDFWVPFTFASVKKTRIEHANEWNYNQSTAERC